MNYIDLHVHSTASDGSYTPSELVHYAIEKVLSLSHLQTTILLQELTRPLTRLN